MKKLITLLAALTLAAASYSQEQAPAQIPSTQGLSAQETAELGVESLLQTIEESRELYNSDQDAFFARIEAVLGYFIDFEAVAVVVMSRYAQQASAEQKTRFASILKTNLTRFYGASLLSYEGDELIFLPAADNGGDPRADQIVSMQLQGESGLRLQYQMFINENDEWKLKNLSLSGINLGRQYYNQFAALMDEHGNNIDQVLDSWQ